MSWTKIEQLQKGKYEIVAYYDQKTDNLTWVKPLPSETYHTSKTNNQSTTTTKMTAVITGTATTLLTTPTTTTTTSVNLFQNENSAEEQNRIIWLGKKIPQDRTIVKLELRILNVWLYISMVVLSLFGVFFAAFLIYFNFKYAHRR